MPSQHSFPSTKFILPVAYCTCHLSPTNTSNSSTELNSVLPLPTPVFSSSWKITPTTTINPSREVILPHLINPLGYIVSLTSLECVLSLMTLPLTWPSPDQLTDWFICPKVFNTLVNWCKELTHWERLWCWERLKTGGEGNDRGWDSWMASPTQWKWVWENSRSWGWTRGPGVLQSVGSQRVEPDWETDQKGSLEFG